MHSKLAAAQMATENAAAAECRWQMVEVSRYFNAPPLAAHSFSDGYLQPFRAHEDDVHLKLAIGGTGKAFFSLSRADIDALAAHFQFSPAEREGYPSTRPLAEHVFYDLPLELGVFSADAHLLSLQASPDAEQLARGEAVIILSRRDVVALHKHIYAPPAIVPEPVEDGEVAA